MLLLSFVMLTTCHNDFRVIWCAPMDQLGGVFLIQEFGLRCYAKVRRHFGYPNMWLLYFVLVVRTCHQSTMTLSATTEQEWCLWQVFKPDRQLRCCITIDYFCHFKAFHWYFTLCFINSYYTQASPALNIVLPTFSPRLYVYSPA